MTEHLDTLKLEYIASSETEENELREKIGILEKHMHFDDSVTPIDTSSPEEDRKTQFKGNH